ncbi:peptidase M10A and M12B matrixin and adamalysin [Isoptericola sp. b441]|uniref:Peptidase M10A and M12B matrixin and adamalysin n=1 Tax=Actinotalea lenta TaxID=3064654 RepID=A0ABT9D803_9CELL|nr:MULTISPECIES: peptidase M10A and M12B matrixin and adamalysin [unclassified Isoptericola]MDO8106995.1 peptidase M10A and M12B matrixin and adamalysin [Isoptericola sp. b441]
MVPVAVLALAMLLVTPRLPTAVQVWLAPGLVPGGLLGPDRSDLVLRPEPASLPVPVRSGADAPTPGFEAQDGRLRPAAGPAATGEPHAFLATQQLSGATVPVAWSPCRPVHVVLDPAGAPADAEGQLLAALGALSEATGLAFAYDGTTDERPDPDRTAFQPERYGDRWAPVLVAFDDDVRHDGRDVAGLTEVRSVSVDGGPQVRVSGQVRLSRRTMSYPAAGGAPGWVPVLRHELGHLVGLAHVDDPRELMYPGVGLAATYAAGDLVGLAALGSGPCAPQT